MDAILENGASEDHFGVGSRPNLLLGESKLLPRDILNNLKTLQELSTLREEAFIHLKDLKNLTAMREIDEREIHELQIKVKAREHEILKAVLDISMERRKMCESEETEDSTHLDREMAEIEGASSMLEKAKGKFIFSSSCLTKNLKGGEIVSNTIKCNSTSVTEEVPMEIVESPPRSTVGMPSQGEEGIWRRQSTVVLPQGLEMIQSEESKLVDEKKKAAKKMKDAHEEQLRFTTRHLSDLRKAEESLESVLKVSEARVDLSEKCGDSDPNKLIVENLLFKRLLLKVVKKVVKFAKFDERVKAERIELNYNLNLFEPRLKLLREVKVLTEKRQSCRSSRWTEVTGQNFHHGKRTDSSAEECKHLDDNLAGLDPFLFDSIQ